MRTVLLILLASAAALALTALLARPVVPRPRPAAPRLVPAAIALRAVPNLPLSAATAAAMPVPASFFPPLTERTLSASRRAEPIEPELREAMERIEPVMDPTRLDGPFVPPVFRIWPGTASLVDAFGEHWRLASDDPNVQLPVSPYALAWHRAASLACDDFVKNRAHPVGAPALSALSRADCERVRRRAAQRRDDAAPVPIVAAALKLAVFAAPPPGSRMTSQDFWAAQKARVEAARTALLRKWRAAHNESDAVGLQD